jgi:hypothetical protein
LPIARWVEGAWLLLDGPATLPDRAAVDDAEVFFALLSELDAAGRFDIDRLDAEIGRLFAAPDPLADGSLCLMTIHKSKGLEFDAVILPGLHRKVKGNDPPMLLWDDVVVPGKPSRLLVAPMPPRRVGKAATEGPSAYRFLMDLEKQRSRNEDLRVLYVAATRARRTLHLVGVLERDGEAEGDHWLAPAAGTPLADLWETLEAMAGKPAAAGPENWKLSTGMGFVPDFRRLRSALPPRRPVLQYGAAIPPVAACIPTIDRRPAEIFGTLAHRYLELMADMPENWSDKRIAACVPAMTAWLLAHDVAADESGLLARRLSAQLQGVLASDRGRWILARRESAGAELALGTAGAVSVIDRCFVDDGVRWIVDYKTTPTDGLDAAALSELAESYRAQLERYAALFSGQGRPVRCGVFFVDGARWVELAMPTVQNATGAAG